MYARIPVSLLLLIILLTSCVKTSNSAPTFVSPHIPPITPSTTLPSQPDLEGTPTPPPPFLTMPPQPLHPAATPRLSTEMAVAQAVADLSARLGVDSGTIKVVRISADDFPAQNLGCPSPDDKGAKPVQPASVMGQEIVLAANDRQYVYHAHGGVVVFCGES